MSRILRNHRSVNALEFFLEKHLEDLKLKNYSEYTIKGRRVHIGFFLDWCTERAITEPVEVTRTVLESYQRHVFHYRKKNGEPLSFTGQHDRLVPLRVWFKWMARQSSHPAQPGLRAGTAAPRHPITESGAHGE